MRGEVRRCEGTKAHHSSQQQFNMYDVCTQIQSVVHEEDELRQYVREDRATLLTPFFVMKTRRGYEHTRNNGGPSPNGWVI